jgi:hypothetical protein
MNHQSSERRRWQRMPIDSMAELKNQTLEHTANVLDISGGGALLSVDAAVLNEDPMGISILNVGNYDAAVVRQWDNKVAIEFNLNEDDQYSLQEELETFCRENDFDD